MQTVLTDRERRLVGNLSIPRNVEDLTHQLRTDPYTDTLPEKEVHDALQELMRAGLVVNLGDGLERSPGELAAAVDSHRTAVSMPDEKAKLFEARLLIPSRTWRLKGDVYHFTDEALALLTAPGPNEPAPLAHSAVERLIHEEAQRIYGGDPEKLRADSSVSGKLLETEFVEWASAVAKEAEERTGLKVRMPMAGGAGYNDATELLVLAAENGGTAYQEPNPWFMALCTVAVTDADTGSTITEADYTGYARKSVALADMNAPAAGSSSNANAIIFAGATGGTSTVINGCKCAAATVGRAIKHFSVASTTVSATQTPAQFAAGAFSTSLD